MGLEHVAALFRRIDRSQEQLDALRNEIDAYRRTIRHGVTHDVAHEPNPENPHQELYKLRVLKPPPYFKWALDVGEIVHNARAPLDHLAHALVMSNGNRPQGKPDTKTAFPIFDDPGYYHQTRGAKKTPVPTSGLQKVVGMVGLAATVIEGLQAYHRRRVGMGLWFLHKLWEADKHRLPLIGAGAAVMNTATWAELGKTMPAFIYGGIREFEDGTIFGVGIVQSGTPGDVNVNLDLAVDIRFREPGPWDRRPIVDVLTQGLASARYVIRKLAPLVTWNPYD